MINRDILRASIPVSLLLGAAPVAAQTVGLEEIVVTAQKRAESLQETPISAAAFTAAALEARGIANLSDLTAEVPNLQLAPHPNSGTTNLVFIRGVGNLDDQITQDPSVAVYLDGVYIGRSQGMANEVADLERVEVLRGPQGSLYGRNATGGAINFITSAPELHDFEVKQTVSFGNYDLFRSRTRVNIPVGDTLAVELGYLHARKDGFVDNPGSDVARFGDQRRDAYRAAVRWVPSADLDLRYTYDRSDVGDTPQYIVPVPLYPAFAERPSAGSPAVTGLERNDVLAQGHNFTAAWHITDDLTFNSITGYRKLRNFSNQNYLTGVAGPFALFTNRFNERQKQFSEEIQLIGSGFGSQLEYVLGLYYFDESSRSMARTTTAARIVTDRAVTADNRAYAVYGQGTYSPDALDNRLHMTLGLRWSRDERKATLQDTIMQADGAVTLLPQGNGDNSFSNVSPTAIIAYDLSDQVNTYAKVARGYKSGGYNVRASTSRRFNEGFGPETLTSYELGLKSDLLDRRLRINAALFYADYKDIQLNLQSDPTNPTRTDVLNAGKAHIKGVEIDIAAKPASNLTVTLNYGYTDADYRRIAGLTGENLADMYVFTYIPKHSVNLGLEYVVPDTPLGTLTAGVNYSFRDKTHSNSNDPSYIIPDYSLLNARLTLSEIPLGAGDVRLSLWGKNLTDKEYYSFHGNSGLPSAVFGEPRSYGLDLSFTF